MVALKRLLLRLLPISFLLMNCALAQHKTVPIRIGNADKDISLSKKAYYAISRKDNKTLKELNSLKWRFLDSKTESVKEFPDTVLQYWLKFSTQNNFAVDSTLLLKMSNKMQHAKLYELVGNKLTFVSETGFGARHLNTPIPGDYTRVYLPLKSQKVQVFYLLLNKYINNLAPQKIRIQTFDRAYKEKIEEYDSSPLSSYTTVKLWVAGFYFAVFIYCCLKYFFQRKDIGYLYYALASISWFFRYSLQADAIIIETDLLPRLNSSFIFLLSFVPQNFFYILFLAKFLKVKNNKYLNLLTIFCLAQWVVMVVVITVHYVRPELTVVTKTLWTYQALPFLILTISLSYYTGSKINRNYLQFAFVGLVAISSALLFTLIPKWFNFAHLLPNWYNNINNFVDIVTIAFVIDAILFLTALAYRDRIDEVERNNLKVKNAENEHKILRLQMNPHFIFNCLNSINLYIEQNDSLLASNYLSKFSHLMRLSLVQSRKEKVILSEEITMLKLYLELETMRFKGKLKYKFNIEDDVDIDFIEVPPMLIQPHLENAIWHGLMHKEGGGEITIGVSQNFVEQTLNVTIQDNGVGRAKASELKSKAVEKEKSFGTLITNERIAILNEKFNANTNIAIKDLYNKNRQPIGTLVTINIHLI